MFRCCSNIIATSGNRNSKAYSKTRCEGEVIPLQARCGPEGG